jgi:hypothetical protein
MEIGLQKGCDLCPVLVAMSITVVFDFDNLEKEEPKARVVDFRVESSGQMPSTATANEEHFEASYFVLVSLRSRCHG